MIHRRLYWTGTAVGALLSSSVAFAQLPNPKEVYIKDVAYGGNGCPQGSVGSYISTDAKAFTLIFDEYAVEKGPGIPLKDNRKFCNLNVDLNIPHGFQYSIMRVDYRGFADLDRGVTATIQSSYRFSGVGGGVARPRSTIIRGPVSHDYTKSDVLGLESTVWSPCGVSRAVNIMSQIRLAGTRHGQGLLTVDTIDGEFKQIYALQWRRCR